MVIWRHLVLNITNSLENEELLFVPEGCFAVVQLVDDAAKSPQIRRWLAYVIL